VLVVIVILVMVGSSLFPAFLNRVRDAAARAQCHNNIKQIGLTLQNYHEVYRHYPAATVRAENVPPEKRLSWLFEIEPFLESRPDPGWKSGIEKPWDSKDNLRVIETSFPLFHCPANPNQGKVNFFGPTHYIGLSGVGRDAAWLPLSDPKAGFFGYKRRLTRDDLKRGTGYTLMIVETATLNGPWAAGGFSTVRGVDPEQPPYLGEDGQFSSFHHRSAINVVFPDGSIRTYTDSLSPHIFEALATLAGSETAGETDN
jgi:hypothetical protein